MYKETGHPSPGEGLFSLHSFLRTHFLEKVKDKRDPFPVEGVQRLLFARDFALCDIKGLHLIGNEMRSYSLGSSTQNLARSTCFTHQDQPLLSKKVGHRVPRFP